VLLTADGTPKVADFGLAKDLVEPSVTSTVNSGPALTQTGDILGTPAYMPPEQASGITAHLTPAADVYSLGAMLYEALTGRPPFQAPDALQTLFLVLSTEAVPPRTLQPKLPRDLDTICLKCLEKQARKRYASAKELADDLQRWQAGEPILARPVGVVERTGKWARRHKAGAALVLVSFVLLLALVGFTIAQVVSGAQLKQANDALGANIVALEKANNEADKAYTLATSTLDEIVRDTTVKLGGMPNGEALLLDLLAKQSTLNKQLWALRPNDAGASKRYRLALWQQSTYEGNYGRFQEAALTRQALRDYLATELEKVPDDVDLLAMQVRNAFDTASIANALGQKEAAQSGRTEFIRLSEKFITKLPDHRDTPIFAVQRHWFRGFDALAQDACTAARSMTDPNDRFAFLSTSLDQLAIVLKNADRYSEAQKAFLESEAVLTGGCPRVNPKTAEFCRSGIANSKVNRAQMAFDTDKPAEAKRLYAEAEAILRELVKDFSLTLLYKQTLSDCIFWQGMMAYTDNPQLGKKQMDESIAILDEELKRRTDKNLSDMRQRYIDLRESKMKEKKE
jgi:Protein kinase domain